MVGDLAGSGSQTLSANSTADLVVGEKFGRLANRIWLYAHVIAHARDRSARVFNPCFDEYAPLFEATAQRIVASYPPRRKQSSGSAALRSGLYSAFERVTGILSTRWRSSRFHEIVPTGMNDTYDLSSPAFVDLEERKRLIVLVGWRFRDYAAFDRHEEAIRNYFRPSIQVAEPVSRIVQKARANGTPVWYLRAENEGHGFQRKENADYQFYATVMFLRSTMKLN